MENKSFVGDEVSEKKVLLCSDYTNFESESDGESQEVEEERWILKLEEISLEILVRLKEQCQKRGLTICDKLKVTHVEDFLVRSVS